MASSNASHSGSKAEGSECNAQGIESVLLLSHRLHLNPDFLTPTLSSQHLQVHSAIARLSYHPSLSDHPWQGHLGLCGGPAFIQEAVYLSQALTGCLFVIIFSRHFTNNISGNSHHRHSFSSDPLLPKSPQLSLGQSLPIRTAHSLSYCK